MANVFLVLIILGVMGYITYKIFKKTQVEPGNGGTNPPVEPEIIPGVTIYNRIVNESDYAVVSDIMTEFGYTFLFSESSELMKEDYTGVEYMYVYSYVLKKGDEVILISEEFGNMDACLDNFKEWVKNNL